MRIEFSSEQMRYLTTEFLLPPSVEAIGDASRSQSVELTKLEVRLLRERVGARLQRVGFDTDYRVTSEGTLLESLLDALTDGEGQIGGSR